MDRFTYYAIVDREATVIDPAGLVRRHDFDDGGFVDEGFQRDLNWHRTSAIVEWERGDFADELVEVTDKDADRIIARFRERWGTGG